MQSKLTLPQMLRRPDDEYAMQLRLLRSCVHGFMSSIKMCTDYNKGGSGITAHMSVAYMCAFFVLRTQRVFFNIEPPCILMISPCC
jgi:hypothetical protein